MEKFHLNNIRHLLNNLKSKAWAGIVSVLFVVGFVGEVWGQCTTSSDSYIPSSAPTTPYPMSIGGSGSVNSGVYILVSNIVLGRTYRVVLSSYDLITISSTSNSVITSGYGYVEFTATSNDDIRIHVHNMSGGCKNYAGGGYLSTGSLSMSCISCSDDYPLPPNNFCINPEPFCVDGEKGDLTFPFQMNSGNVSNVKPHNNNYNGGVNDDLKNPNWFYIEATSSGIIDFNVYAEATSPTGPSVHVAVFVWGPFDSKDDAISMCGNLPSPLKKYYVSGAGGNMSSQSVDFDFYTDANKFYLMLITNRTNDRGQVTISANSSNTAATDCSETLLPIELLYFNGQAISQGNLLEWSTQTQTDNDYFTLSSSTDGYTWKEIAQIEGAGNSNEVLTYDFLDRSAEFGTTYYKLRQTDYDGEFEEFDIISVVRSTKEEVLVHPNPSNGNFKVSYYSPKEQDIGLVIYDNLGKPVYNLNEKLNKGVNSIAISLDNVTKGVYFLNTVVGEEVNTQKIIVN